MMADKANAQGDPQVPSYEEIDELFIIGEKKRVYLYPGRWTYEDSKK